MAGWGTILGAALGGPGAATIGAGVDWMLGERNRREMMGQMNSTIDAQMDAIAAQLGIDRADHATLNAIRERLLARGQDYDATLRSVFEALGPQSPIDMDRLNADYNTAFNTNLAALDRAAQIAASKGFASDISRGIDNSTTSDNRVAELQRTLAPEYMRLNQVSWNDALNQNQGRMNVQQQSRDNIMGEYDRIIRGGGDFDTAAMTGLSNGGRAQGAISGLGSMLNTQGNYASAAATAQGRQLNDIAEAISKWRQRD